MNIVVIQKKFILQNVSATFSNLDKKHASELAGLMLSVEGFSVSASTNTTDENLKDITVKADIDITGIFDVLNVLDGNHFLDDEQVVHLKSEILKTIKPEVVLHYANTILAEKISEVFKQAPKEEE